MKKLVAQKWFIVSFCFLFVFSGIIMASYYKNNAINSRQVVK